MCILAIESTCFCNFLYYQLISIVRTSDKQFDLICEELYLNFPILQKFTDFQSCSFPPSKLPVFCTFSFHSHRSSKGKGKGKDEGSLYMNIPFGVKLKCTNEFSVTHNSLFFECLLPGS